MTGDTKFFIKAIIIIWILIAALASPFVKEPDYFRDSAPSTFTPEKVIPFDPVKDANASLKKTKTYRKSFKDPFTDKLTKEDIRRLDDWFNQQYEQLDEGDVQQIIEDNR